MRRYQVATVLSAVVLVAALVSPASAQPSPGVDLTLKVNGPSEALVGTTFPVVLTVRNVGTEAATDVELTTYLDRALTRDSFVTSDPAMSCADGEYSEFACSLPSLAAGGSASLTLTVTRTAARETWVDAWVASTDAEADDGNNYGGLYVEPDRSEPADVGLVLSAPEQPEPNANFDYTARITNFGPKTARSVTYTQSLSELVKFVSATGSGDDDVCTLFQETYDEEGIEGGPFTYSEVRCDLGDMPHTSRATITITVERTDPHELWASGWLASSTFDGNYENDYADLSTAGDPSVTSDLAVSVVAPEHTPLVGDEFTYTMSVTNIGPAPAPDAVLNTWLPEQLALRAITGGRDGDVCAEDEWGGINCTLAPLPSGETVTFEVAVTRVRARGFWMSIGAWSTNYDPSWENSYYEAEVAADRSNPADVGVRLDGPTEPAVGSSFDYTIGVTNNGPNAANAVALTSAVPEGTEFVSVSSSDGTDVCELYEETYEGEGEKLADGSYDDYTYREVRCDLGTMAAAEIATITLTVTRVSEYEVWNHVWVATASYDGNFGNDSDNLGSSGKRYRDCGSEDGSDGGDGGDVIVICDEAAGGKGGDGYASGGDTDKKRIVPGGGGADSITVHIPSHSKKRRHIVIKGGKGNDVIKVLFAPGAGNVKLTIKGGGGDDQIKVIAPRPGKRMKVRQIGGTGADVCTSHRLDRKRSWSC